MWPEAVLLGELSAASLWGRLNALGVFARRATDSRTLLLGVAES